MKKFSIEAIRNVFKKNKSIVQISSIETFLDNLEKEEKKINLKKSKNEDINSN